MGRVDFHVHTPASGDFLGGGSVGDVLDAARDAQLDALVVTDHNTLDGYLEVAGRLDSWTPMAVFPGVEVSCRGGPAGIHVLAVLDPARLGSRPRNLLRALGLEKEDRVEGGLSRFDVAGVCSAVHDQGGLAIAAHAISDKGVLRELRGIQLERVLADSGFDAVELSTPRQRVRGGEQLTRLGMLDSVTVVSGSDSHRAAETPGADRPEGPGSRPSPLEIPSPCRFEALKEALRVAAGTFRAEAVLPLDPLQRFRDAEPGVLAVWKCTDRVAVTRAVAGSATAGGGLVLLGVRRGGRGGRGVVMAATLPAAEDVERWVWSDVRPVPVVRVDEHAGPGGAFLGVEVLPDVQPFVFSVGGVPLARQGQRVVRAQVGSHDEKALLQQFRRAVTAPMLARLRDRSSEPLTVGDLEGLFPWRGYLTPAEIDLAVRHVVYWLTKRGASGVLRSWAFAAPDVFATAAEEHVRLTSRTFTVSHLRTSLGRSLDAVGLSRTLRRRVVAAFDGLLPVADPLDAAGIDEQVETGVLARTCERLASAATDPGFEEARLRDVMIHETRRTQELVGALVTDAQVRVVIEAVAQEVGAEHAETIRTALVEGSSVSVVTAAEAGAVEGREVALVSSGGDDVLVVGPAVLAVPTPVRDLPSLLGRHREIGRWRQGHVLDRGELLDVIAHRHEVSLSPEDARLVFSSCALRQLPVWWAYSGEVPYESLAERVAAVIAETRSGVELHALLAVLALLPGNHETVGQLAADRSRAQPVQQTAAMLSLAWETRVKANVPACQPVASLTTPVVHHGAPVTVDGVHVTERLRRGDLNPAAADRQVAEACARRLKNVASPVLFDLFLRGVREGWQTGTALRSCGVATFLPSAVRDLVQPASRG